MVQTRARTTAATTTLTAVLLCLVCRALGSTTLTTTPGVVLDAPRTMPPGLPPNPAFDFALTSPGVIPDPFPIGSPDWIKWNTSMHAAVDHIMASECPADVGTPNSAPWYWSFCGLNAKHIAYSDECNRVLEAIRDAMTACTVFYRERIYAQTSRYPKEFGGFWSASCRCLYVANYVESMLTTEHSGIASICGVPTHDSSFVVQGFMLQAYRVPGGTYSEANLFAGIRATVSMAMASQANGGADVSVAKYPPIEGRWIMDSYNCSVGALNELDARKSTGGDYDYARDALWAIPPVSHLGPIVTPPSGGGPPNTASGTAPSNPSDSAGSATPPDSHAASTVPALVWLLGVAFALMLGLCP